MAFVRSIGRWTMTALVVNSIIGNSIFGLPGELSRLLGRAIWEIIETDAAP